MEVQSPLFAGIAKEEMNGLLRCLQDRRLRFKKGDILLRAGSPAQALGLVLSGSVTIEQVDVWGNRSIMGRAEAGAVFAEAYACSAGEPLMVDVVADSEGEALFLQVEKILTPCACACPFHGRLVRNLLRVIAVKNLGLARKIRCITPKAIRDRLLIYLSGQAVQAGQREFTIPFDRQGLADYLCVDRSALSACLSRLREEGVLSYRKNRFTLLTHTED